mmetsp:Transcript_29610/g.49986  ORF Transcript_29610/g.49986 Transcript_29610/m.49986 type:complete len:221 (+) Transcript_29610:817-1479(+)
MCTIWVDIAVRYSACTTTTTTIIIIISATSRFANTATTASTSNRRGGMVVVVLHDSTQLHHALALVVHLAHSVPEGRQLAQCARPLLLEHCFGCTNGRSVLSNQSKVTLLSSMRLLLRLQFLLGAQKLLVGHSQSSPNIVRDFGVHHKVPLLRLERLELHFQLLAFLTGLLELRRQSVRLFACRLQPIRLLSPPTTTTTDLSTSSTSSGNTSTSTSCNII